METQNAAEIKLIRPAGGKSVEIRYQAKSGCSGSAEKAKAGKAEEKEEQPAKKGAVAEFCIVVRAKDNSGLIFDCFSEDEQLRVLRVSHHRDVDRVLDGVDSEAVSRSYAGPGFASLDAKVQLDFLQYLEYLGITEKLLGYVERSAMDKEQRLYEGWLENVKQFAEPQ